MSSPEFSQESIDLLIAQVLHSQFGAAEPSPRAWKRICRRAGIWAARLYSGPFPSHSPLGGRDMTARRYEIATLCLSNSIGLVFNLVC